MILVRKKTNDDRVSADLKRAVNPFVRTEGSGIRIPDAGPQRSLRHHGRWCVCHAVGPLRCIHPAGGRRRITGTFKDKNTPGPFPLPPPNLRANFRPKHPHQEATYFQRGCYVVLNISHQRGRSSGWSRCQCPAVQRGPHVAHPRKDRVSL